MNRQASRCRHLGDDERSEDSDTRKHTKMSIIKVGLSEVEVLGKHAVHDDILRMHIEEYHGYFGDMAISEKNIIQGMTPWERTPLRYTQNCMRL